MQFRLCLLSLDQRIEESVEIQKICNDMEEEILARLDECKMDTSGEGTKIPAVRVPPYMRATQMKGASYSSTL